MKSNELPQNIAMLPQKDAARIDGTNMKSPLRSEKRKELGGNLEVANCTFGKSTDKTGFLNSTISAQKVARGICRSGNYYLTKHMKHSLTMQKPVRSQK